LHHLHKNIDDLHLFEFGPSHQNPVSSDGIEQFFFAGGQFWHHKALLGFFICIFSSITCLKKPVFSKRHLLGWKVAASLSLFL
jgi:hypothetical protein